MNILEQVIAIAESGLHAQATRMRVVSENLANIDTTASNPSEQPYRRKTVSFANILDDKTNSFLVKVKKIGLDNSPFGMKFLPGHPAATNDGYVYTPNVNQILEDADLRQAQQSYENNVKVIEIARNMIISTIDLLKL